MDYALRYGAFIPPELYPAEPLRYEVCVYAYGAADSTFMEQ